MMQRRGFTMLELMIVMSVIVILIGLLVPALLSVRHSMRKAETASLIGSVIQAMDNYAVSEGGLPTPDSLYFLEFDDRDMDSVAELKNYSRWPTLNKLIHLGLTFDRKLHLAPQGGRQRLVDSWGGAIRYVVGDDADDNGHAPQGSFDDWNWDPANGEPIEPVYPYVYSYGRDNPDGSDLSEWIYERRQR